MTVQEIRAASNMQLIRRLAVISEHVLTHRHATPDLAKERARIWQEFGDRRGAGRLRMTPKTIRGKVFQAQLKLHS